MPALAVSGYDSAYNSESAFLAIDPGETKAFQVFFVNTGTVTWIKGSSSQVDLAACREDKVTCNAQDPGEATWNSGWLSTGRYATTTQATVAPNEVATFAYNIKAPSDATGTHRFNGDVVVASSGTRIHPEGYYQDATVNAVGQTGQTTGGGTAGGGGTGGGGGGTSGGGGTTLGTLTVNGGLTATGCPGPEFSTTFVGAGLAGNTTYQLTFTRTAPPPPFTGSPLSVTTDAAGAFTKLVLTSGAVAPSSFTIVVKSGDTSKTNPVTVTFACEGPIADLSITKSDSPDPVVAGADITYTIRLRNNGPTDASDVGVTDMIPTNTTFVSFQAPEGWSSSTPTAGGTGAVQASKSTLSNTSGFQVFTLVVNVNPQASAGSPIDNTATVGADTVDPISANNSSTTRTTVVAGNADLSIMKTDSPDPVMAGGNLTYALTAHNAGPTMAALAMIGDTLPAGTTFVSFTGPTGWTTTKPAVGGTGTVTASKSNFAADSSAAFTLMVKVNANVPSGTTITNTAMIQSATSDPDEDNNWASQTTTVGTSADLSVVKADLPDPVSAGNNITYTITATNNGPSDAQNVALFDVLPVGTTFVSFTQNSGPTFTLNAPHPGATGTAVGTIATLASGASATFTLVVKVPASTTDQTTITNTATITSATADSNPANNSDTETTAVNTRADLGVTKSDSPDPVIAGSNITYAIAVSNGGPSDAQAVTLSDAIPANTTFVSFAAPAGWTSSTPPVDGTGSVTSTKATLEAGATANFTLVVKVSSGTKPHTTITNAVTVTSATTDPNLTNNFATATTDVANPLLCFAGGDGICTLTQSGAHLDNSAGPFSGVYYQVSKFTGKHLAEVTNLSFNYVGSPVGGGTPRITVPIDDDKDAVLDGVTNSYAFISAEHCTTPGLVSLSSCRIFYGSDASAFPGYANWTDFAAAHPTWTVAITGDGDPTVPYVVADTTSTWDVSNVHLGE
jgi:uncharacterized repeat protein (TIGR01451 family)